MIQSVKHKGLELFFKTGRKSGIQAKHVKRLQLILAPLMLLHHLVTWIYQACSCTNSRVIEQKTGLYVQMETGV